MKPVRQLTKVEVIEGSLKCFRSGLLSLVPVVGIPVAVRVIVRYVRIKRGKGDLWNPAQRYLFWGGQSAACGLLLNLVVTGLIAAACYNKWLAP